MARCIFVLSKHPRKVSVLHPSYGEQRPFHHIICRPGVGIPRKDSMEGVGSAGAWGMTITRKHGQTKLRTCDKLANPLHLKLDLNAWNTRPQRLERYLHDHESPASPNSPIRLISGSPHRSESRRKTHATLSCLKQE